MSEANVDTVRWVYENGHAMRTVDVPGVDERVAPGYLFHPRPGFPGQEVYRLDEMVKLWADLDTTLGDYSLVPQSYESLGAAHVLVTLHQRALLRGSDQWLDDTIYMLWHLPDGRIHETWTFTDRPEAVEAAGLRG